MNTKSKEKISVIMSVYNGMPYLKEAVESILSQTHKNFEFIIVDDASKDSSWVYLESLKDKRIKLIRNRKNLGLAASLNKALRQVFDREAQTGSAQGDFIARMDADDISVPSRLEKQVIFLNANREIELCGSWATLIDEKNNKIGSLNYPKSPSDIKNKLILYNPIVHPSIMARRSFFDSLNGYAEKYDGAEDYELLTRGKNKFKYANLPEELLLLRLSPSRRSIKSMKHMDKLDLKIKIGSIKKNGLSAVAAYAIIRKLIFMYLMPSPLKLKIARALKKA